MGSTVTLKRRAPRARTTLGPELDKRLDAVRLARNPPPTLAALVRAAVLAGLPVLERSEVA